VADTWPETGTVGRPAALPARGWAFDFLLVLLVLPTSAPYLHHQGVRLSATTAAWLMLGALPILVRRIWPVTAFVLISVIGLVAALLQQGLTPSSAVLVAMYTVAALCPRRTALIAAVALEISGIVLCVRLQDSDWWYGAIFLSGLVTAALGLGLYSATRRAYLAELHDRARRAERERDQQGARP
jgi:hypothetical protein